MDIDPSAQARTVASPIRCEAAIGSLVLLAALLAAGFILNLTVGNALAATGIKPQFIISAYTLAILLTGADVRQAAVFGLISAAVIQFSTSIPGLNFATELAGATCAALIGRACLRIAGRDVTPLAAGGLATLVSGTLFAVAGTLLMGTALPTALVKVPLVLGTTVFNALVVQCLSAPLRAALNR